MYLYTTKNNKLEGLQNIETWTKEEIQQVKEALKLSGREMILSDAGLTICRECRVILGHSGNFDGDIARWLCTRC